MDEREAEKVQNKLRDERKPDTLKKFYKEACVAGKAPPYSIALDGRTMKTPLKSTLEIPTKALAEAIAAEWNAQEEVVDLAQMYLTKYANTAIDVVALRKEAVVDEIVAFASSDLICYRADTPQGLVERQTAAWDPVLAWAQKTHKLNFICVAGVIYASQPEPTLALAHEMLMARDAYGLTAIHNLTTLTGSALLSVAVVEGAITPQACWSAAHLDEDWNIELWGTDEDASRRRAVRREEFDGILRFYELAS